MRGAIGWEKVRATLRARTSDGHRGAASPSPRGSAAWLWVPGPAGFRSVRPRGAPRTALASVGDGPGFFWGREEGSGQARSGATPVRIPVGGPTQGVTVLRHSVSYCVSSPSC